MGGMTDRKFPQIQMELWVRTLFPGAQASSGSMHLVGIIDVDGTLTLADPEEMEYQLHSAAAEIMLTFQTM